MMPYSFAVVDPQEPDDTHGRCGDVDDVWNAETDGEQYVPIPIPRQSQSFLSSIRD
jgi:hypothetical protein